MEDLQDRSFPRPLGCGPIEAIETRSLLRTNLNFPRPLGCGPIEANSEFLRFGIDDGVANFAFPRPLGCGPIEAAFVIPFSL